MPMFYEIEIPGKAMGKQRPKMGRFGVYTPKKTVSYENLVKTLFIEKYGQPVLTGYIRAEITIYYEIPKSTSKKRSEAMLRGIIKPDKKPDCDNVAKIILDSLNKIAYSDDKQITQLSVFKEYKEKSSVVVKISEI